MIKIAICDDDMGLCSELESKLIFLSKKYQIRTEISIFYSGLSLLKYMNSEEDFDIIFLDIELGEFGGVQVGETIRNDYMNQTVQIVYISVKECYAMELFDTRPMNFLVKPLVSEKLERVFATALRLVQAGEEYFTYNVNQKSYRQPVKDILYFECLEKKIKMACVGREVLFYARMKQVERQVENLGFIKVHKSYIINLNHIRKYEYEQITMINGAVIPVSQSKRSLIRKVLMDIRRGTVL